MWLPASSRPFSFLSPSPPSFQAPVLVLSVNSESYSPGTPNHPLTVASVSQCCQKCRATAGCQAFTFWCGKG